MKRQILLSLLTLISLSACLEKEEPIPGRPSGEEQEASLHMGDTYANQIYFDLGSGSVVAQVDKYTWDLAFSTSSVNGIFLNEGKAMFAAPTGSSDFSGEPVLSQLTFGFDDPAGEESKTAIREAENQQVWVVNRGVSAAGTQLGYFKLQILEFNEGEWRIKVGELSDLNGTLLTIPADTSYNFEFFSFETLGTLEVEPPKDSWVLWFTSYLESLINGADTIPYLVTGVLINTSGVAVARDTTHGFREITREFAEQLDYTQERNRIGYDWKFYDFDLGYLVNPEINYLIQDHFGLFYKLHFIDFYDSTGTKGSPKFEFQRL